MTSGSRPLCFVLMPFGTKPDASGAVIDFDAVYSELIAPAIQDAGLEPLRADEEITGGIIHKAMFERLMLCDYAIADLTTANANVFYELGVRHAVRPYTTILLFAEGRRLPFDVNMLRAVQYRLDESGKPTNVSRTQAKLADLLDAARKPEAADSPVFTLISDWKPPAVDHTKTDTFRERVRYSEHLKEQLARARRRGVEALQSLESELGPIADQDAGVVMDLFLSYRSVKAWERMFALYKQMSAPLQATVMAREQLALALNRAGDSAEAERILERLISERGPSSETYGILGRVYKDRWETAAGDGDSVAAAGYLRKAIDAYVRGFEADWRDAYPGVNAVTLMELRDPPDERRDKLLPLVRYAVERRVASGQPDYWDYATLVELAVLARDEKQCRASLEDAVANIRESWEPETTARNIQLINNARKGRGEVVPWALDVQKILEAKGQRSTTRA